MAVFRSKPSSTFVTGPPRKHPRRNLRKEDSAATLPLDASLNSGTQHKSDFTVPKSILRFSSDELSLQVSFGEGNSNNEPKHVSFGQLQIHCHEYTLGDNPSLSGKGGIPVTLDWNAFESHTLSLELYERDKPESRPKESMIMPSSMRERLVRARGFSRGEIKEAAEEVERVQNQRLRSSRDGRLLRGVQRWAKKLNIGNGCSI